MFILALQLAYEDSSKNSSSIGLLNNYFTNELSNRLSGQVPK